MITHEQLLEKIKAELNRVNSEQAALRQKNHYMPPAFVAHATHVSQDEYKESAPKCFENQNSEEIVPAFSKGTQNELSAVKKILEITGGELCKGDLTYPKRVFAISTKVDDKGKPILDNEGRPVPQDGSYAYSLKECCKSINFVDNVPLLIGYEDKYKDFEEGKRQGHIYIGSGDKFSAEYDLQGNITEYTSPDDMNVLYHLTTIPQDAMQHNVQLVMFDTVEHLEQWFNRVGKLEQGTGTDFETFMTSDSIRMQSLREEILSGRATYINASDRGFNPQIKNLEVAEDIKARISIIKEKINKNKNLSKAENDLFYEDSNAAVQRNSENNLYLASIAKIKYFSKKR